MLRDASAAAIYGANAANGVVLITTKRGATGQARGPQVEYTGSVSASTVTRLPAMLNAAQFRAAVQQYAPQNVGQLRNANTDWFGLVDRTGFGQEHNLAVSGAGASNELAAVGRLPRPGRHHPTANSTRRIGLGLNFDQRLAQRPAGPALQPEGLARRTTVHARRRALQRGPVWARPSRSSTRPPRPATTTGRATRCQSRGQSGGHPGACRGQGHDLSQPSATCRPSTACPSSTGSGPTSTSATTSTKADRQNFTPSMLHGQIEDAATAAATTAPTRASRTQVLETLPQLHHAAPGRAPARST